MPNAGPRRVVAQVSFLTVYHSDVTFVWLHIITADRCNLAGGRRDVIKRDGLIIAAPRSRACEGAPVVDIPPSSLSECEIFQASSFPSRLGLHPAAAAPLLPTLLWCSLAAALLWSVAQAALSRDVWIKFAKLLENAGEKSSALLPAEPQPHWRRVC